MARAYAIWRTSYNSASSENCERRRPLVAIHQQVVDTDSLVVRTGHLMRIFALIGGVALVGAIFVGILALTPPTTPSIEQPMAEVAKTNCGLLTAETTFKTSPALEACAADGNIDAMAWLGMMYWGASDGITQDFIAEDAPASEQALRAKGTELLTRAAESGQLLAANELGVAYMFGSFGMALDYQKAMAWFQHAHDGGDALATQNIAAMYANGRGVPRSRTKAIDWLETAAERGSVVANWTMGSLFLAANTEQDRQKADAYFKRADKLGGECARPTEVCDDFKSLFEKDELIAANEYVATVPLTYC